MAIDNEDDTYQPEVMTEEKEKLQEMDQTMESKTLKEQQNHMLARVRVRVRARVRVKVLVCLEAIVVKVVESLRRIL